METVVHWVSIGVWPCWVTQSSLGPVKVPTPSSTAKIAGLPWVQFSHCACIEASLAGLYVVMIGLILRPLIPPLSLI